VTNVQYQRFLEASDFAEREYWVDFPKFGQPDEETGAIEETSNWGDEGWEWLQNALNDEDTSEDGKVVLPRYWQSLRFGIARASVPVVGITWYEASAYCKWLLAHWGELPEAAQNHDLKPGLIRLPTEVEWMAAAEWNEPGERFPWDVNGEATRNEAEILRRANVSESGIGRTTPVGMYPLGASPGGVWDMGGNVWEWQANYYSDSRKTLALRGSSWLSYHYSARMSGRNDYHPSRQWYGSGFRVVALPS
jgi:formylglycine-generating enzyme required for sulfatase activity